MSEFKDAEKMFKFFKGNGCLMSRGEDYTIYKEFGTPPELENKWRHEMKNDFFEKLNQATNRSLIANYFFEFGSIISQIKDKDGFEFMLEYIKRNLDTFDSNTLLRTVGTVIETDRAFNKGKLSLNIRNEALSLLRDALQKPIWISKDYFENGKLPDYLTPDIVKNKIIGKIQYWENLGNN